MTNCAIDIETLFPPFHQIARHRHRQAGSPIRTHLASVVIICSSAESQARSRIHLGNERSRSRARFARHLGHFVPYWNCAGDWHASAAPIGKESERRLRTHFRLAHHVRKNFNRRTSALLSAQAENGDDGDAGQQKNKKEAAEHI